MDQAKSDKGGKPAQAAAPALLTLASRTDLPPRVRHLLEGTLSLCSSKLEKVLVATLDDLEAQLFKRAEQSRSNELQYRCFDTLREIKRSRADIAPRFMLELEDTLARFGQYRDAAAPHERAPPLKELALVETKQLEESLALQEFSARAEIRQAQPLYALGHRMAVLAASPVIDAEHLPIGPAQLANAMRHACASLQIVPDHRVLLYHCFDRITAEALGSLYTEINRYFVEHRILAHLHLLAAPRAKSAPEAKTPAAAHARQSGTVPPATLGLSADHVTPRSRPGAAHAQGVPAAQTQAMDSRDEELFVTLRELLNGRDSQAQKSSRASDGYVPSNDEVQSVLGALQSRPISPMLQDGKLAQRSVGLLKQELLANLRQLAPNGQAPRLSSEDSDTIDLVGMLFEYLTKHTRPYGSTQSLMTKLQVPLLRVALRDKSFFTRRAHPARQLLNTIAETGNHWLDERDGAADRGLVDKMQLVVDRVLQDFDGNNLALIEDMLGELSTHMHTLARKAEVTERRHVDAARGREKLSLAREQARDEIAKRIAAARPSKLVRTLLEQAWTDVLALTLLRQGEKSEAYTKRLAVADRLLAMSASRTGDAKVAPALREEIETALNQVGYHHDDVQAITKRLFELEAAHGDDPSSSTELAIKLKNKPHLGDDTTAPAPKHLPARKEFAAESAEARALERLKTMPFGTWFELTINQQGERVRRKLAWFSTVTGHALFVNQRGVRTDEKTLHQLAYDVVHGQATIVEPEQDSLVDRAWKTVMASLRQLVGREAAAKPA